MLEAPDWICRYCNPAGARMVHRVIGDLIGKRVFEEFPNAANSVLDATYRAVVADGVSRVVVYHSAALGRTFEVNVAPIDSGITVYWRDVTERTRAELALQASEARFRSLMVHAADALFISDSVGNYVDANPAATALVGYEREELLRMNARQLILDPAEDRLDPELDEIRAGSVSRRTWMARHKDGSVVDVEATISQLSDGTLLGVARDITRRKQLEHEVRTSLAEKETLLREIHHRVKNNLQVVSSLLHFHAKRYSAPEDIAAFKALRQRIFAMTLVHERLYRARDVARIDFGEYIRELVVELRRSMTVRAGVEIVCATDDIRLPIEQAMPCGMIVNELVTNALKHAFADGRGGRVTVTLSVRDGVIGIAVCDDGVGFPAGFDGGGSGSFGWQLLDTLVKQLDGTLAATNETGACVRVEFPSR